MENQRNIVGTLQLSLPTDIDTIMVPVAYTWDRIYEILVSFDRPNNATSSSKANIPHMCVAFLQISAVPPCEFIREH